MVKPQGVALRSKQLEHVVSLTWVKSTCRLTCAMQYCLSVHAPDYNETSGLRLHMSAWSEEGAVRHTSGPTVFTNHVNACGGSRSAAAATQDVTHPVSNKILGAMYIAHAYIHIIFR